MRGNAESGLPRVIHRAGDKPVHCCGMFAVRSRRRHRSPARYLRRMSSQSGQFTTTIADGQRIPLLVNALARGNDIYVRISPRTT